MLYVFESILLWLQVSCDVCGYMSTKEEPFLFLSLPLPHANERQISELCDCSHLCDFIMN